MQNIARLEMEAYDSLPCVVRKVFDNAPRKVSVLGVMRLPGFRKAYDEMEPEEFAKVLEGHLQTQAEQEAVVST